MSIIVIKPLESLTSLRFVSPTDLYWQEILDIIPHDFYHLPTYLELEANRYNASPEAIIIKDGEQIFFLPYLIRDCSYLLNSRNGGIDRIYDAISPYGYPGILVSQAGENHQFIKTCFDVIYNCWRERNICAAFIRLHPLLSNYIDHSIDDDNNFVVCNQGDVVVCDLAKSTEDISKQIRSSHRNKNNKLNRCGFEVKMGSPAEYLDVFIDIYRETMDRVNAAKSYYFTPEYFQRLVKILEDRLNICIVEINGQVVSASLITEFSGIVQYHLGGTKTEFLRQSPATMMFKYIIDWAKSRNNKYLNFGGGLGGSKDSLYHFKSGFSTESKSFTTIKTIVNIEAYNQLVHARANSLGTTISEIENTSFFPAYRSR
jgi:hypothetical protein